MSDPKDPTLFDEMLILSERTRLAHRAAVREGREEVAEDLRKLGWTVAAMLAMVARQESERPSEERTS